MARALRALARSTRTRLVHYWQLAIPLLLVRVATVALAGDPPCADFGGVGDDGGGAGGERAHAGVVSRVGGGRRLGVVVATVCGGAALVCAHRPFLVAHARGPWSAARGSRPVGQGWSFWLQYVRAPPGAVRVAWTGMRYVGESTVRVHAGTTFAELQRFLSADGRTLRDRGQFDGGNVAAAVRTRVHGFCATEWFAQQVVRVEAARRGTGEVRCAVARRDAWFEEPRVGRLGDPHGGPARDRRRPRARAVRAPVRRLGERRLTAWCWWSRHGVPTTVDDADGEAVGEGCAVPRCHNLRFLCTGRRAPPVPALGGADGRGRCGLVEFVSMRLLGYRNTELFTTELSSLETTLRGARRAPRLRRAHGDPAPRRRRPRHCSDLRDRHGAHVGGRCARSWARCTRRRACARRRRTRASTGPRPWRRCSGATTRRAARSCCA